jgi:lipoprotein-releasing system permease protein
MGLPFELAVALRYLTARRRQAFISLISAISILGVMVGVMALFVALGLMTGLQAEIRTNILGSTAHLSVFRRGGVIEDAEAIVGRVRAIRGVLGAAPAVYGKALLTSATGSAVATLKGIEPAQECTVTGLAEQVIAGRFEDLEASATAQGLPPALLGRDLAGGLGVEVGDVVTVTSPEGRLSPVGMVPRMAKVRVAGLVRTGLYEFDSSWAYLPIQTSQRLLGLGDRVTLVEVRTENMYAVRELASRILALLGESYVTTDWIQMNESLFSALWLEKVAIGITIGLIVAVAALNIVATLILMVAEKHKDIAILVSMGASHGAIMRIFVLQGTIIGAVGTAVGASLGWAACAVLDRYELIRIPMDVYQVSHVPFQLLATEASSVVLGALVLCFLATLYPAWAAARVDPAEALRYE